MWTFRPRERLMGGMEVEGEGEVDVVEFGDAGESDIMAF
jgi:hypothetical protein